MTAANEYTLVEKPIIDTLTSRYGYRAIHASEHSGLRLYENEVLFKPVLVAALMRINKIPVADAEAVFHELSGVADNETWLNLLRGHYSRQLIAEDSTRPLGWSISTIPAITTLPSPISCACKAR